MIVDLCTKAVKMCSEQESDGFLTLSRQVIAWASRHVRSPAEKAVFETALEKLNAYSEK